MRVIKYAMAFSLMAMVVGAATGCGDDGTDGSTGPAACTLIGCGPAFRVEFQRASWPAGAVTIVVEADGATTTCNVTLPFASCDAALQCDNPAPAFLVELSGCALPADQHAITGVTWSENGPQQVTVTVSQDGTMLGTQMFQPMYTQSRPNGPDCDPVCTQAPEPTPMQL